MKLTLALVSIAAIVTFAGDLLHGRILRALITLAIAAVATLAFMVF